MQRTAGVSSHPNSQDISLAATITKEASKQTYYTIRLLADRNFASDAYRAYAYFRWVDDILDSEHGCLAEKQDFIRRQLVILDACYQANVPSDLCPEEEMLASLVQHDDGDGSGLRSYLNNMMGVMIFDVERRGCTISQYELSEYSHLLSTAVTEALHYFIGHDCPPPFSENRYLAVRGAHIVHMLRDMVEDISTGYYNIPSEYVEEHFISFDDLDNPACRRWVRGRVELARSCFQKGREYIDQVRHLRCRLAGYAYIARFEWVLVAIERDGYRLREAYPKRKGLRTALWIANRTLSSFLGLNRLKPQPCRPAARLVRTDKR